MKEVKVSLLEGDMILNIEKSKDYVCVHTHTHTHTHGTEANKHIQQHCVYCYKINTQKPITFLHTVNNQKMKLRKSHLQ